MQATKVLIVDDNAGFRWRVKDFLIVESSIQVVGEAGNGQEAVEKAIALQPDVVLMDVRMGGMNGLSATRQIKERLPGVCVIILSRFDLQEYRKAAQDSGASGYVVKRSLMNDLLSEIKRTTLSLSKAEDVSPQSPNSTSREEEIRGRETQSLDKPQA